MYRRFYLLYISYGELFRMITFEILVEQLDFAHVLFNVIRRVECLTQGNGLCCEVNASQDDRNTCAFGDVVESAFLVRIGLSGSFRSDGQVEMLALLDQANHLFD